MLAIAVDSVARADHSPEPAEAAPQVVILRVPTPGAEQDRSAANDAWKHHVPSSPHGVSEKQIPLQPWLPRRWPVDGAHTAPGRTEIFDGAGDERDLFV